jgi:hypothetical protein
MVAARIFEEPWSPQEDVRPHLHIVEVPKTQKVNALGVPVSARRAARARMLRRRRRTLGIFVVVIASVLLAVPGHAFGGVTTTGVASDEAASSLLAPGMVYVVASGDTVNSIAKMINPWSPQIAERALTKELGSNVVIPGEHVLIP